MPPASDPARPPTLHAVAAAAGVSHQTVSRVVNGAPNVAEPTRRRVLKAVRSLQYRPNQAARHLVQRRSRLIGVISYGTNFYGPAQALTSIDGAARRGGYQVLLAGVTDLRRRTLREAADGLVAHGVAGILINVPLDLAFAEVQSGLAGIPFVALDASTRRPYPTVQFDHRLGSCLATRHLIEEGHRDIACLGGDPTWCCGRLRVEGWLQAIAEAGLRPGPRVDVDWSAEGGHAGALRLLDGPAPFTAVAAANDQLALGAIAALTARGLRVPDDVSITGFDDMPEARYFQPALTTVRLDFPAFAEIGLRSLLHHLEGAESSSLHTTVRPELVVRASTRRIDARSNKR